MLLHINNNMFASLQLFLKNMENMTVNQSFYCVYYMQILDICNKILVQHNTIPTISGVPLKNFGKTYWPVFENWTYLTLSIFEK